MSGDVGKMISAVVVGAIACGGNDAPVTRATTPVARATAKVPAAPSTLPLEPRVVKLSYTPHGPRTYRLSVPVGATESRVDAKGNDFASVTYHFGSDSHLMLVANTKPACTETPYRALPWTGLLEVLKANDRPVLQMRCGIAAEAHRTGTDGVPQIHIHYEWIDGPLTHTCHAELFGDQLSVWREIVEICERVAATR